jgi:hypothetical protein
MSSSSHMAGRLRELYGTILGRMQILNARCNCPGLARLKSEPIQICPGMMDHLEPRLLLSHTLSFDGTVPATDTDPYSVISADFNGDGNMDLVTANCSGCTVSVLLGNGDGTFKVKTDIATGSNPYSVVAADLNGDGNLDLVTANHSGKGLSILLGNGDGTFNGQTGIAIGAWTESVIIADFNNDGTMDLATTNYKVLNSQIYDAFVSVLLGNGDGTFRAKTDYATGTGSFPYSVAAADLNNDGNLDLVTANDNPVGNGGTISVLMGNGDGTFKDKSDIATANVPYSVIIADLNGDGNMDMVTTNGITSISVFLGNGDGTFKAKTDIATANMPLSVIIADLNGDGNMDMVTANYTGCTVSVLLGNGDGTFKAKTDLAVGTYPDSVTVADLNNDGNLDLVTANSATASVSILLGDGDGSFQNKSYFTWNDYSVSHNLDLNGDGNLDSFRVNYTANTVSVFLGNSDGTFKAKTDYATGLGIIYVIATDINGDGNIDLVTANNGANTISVLLGNGDGTFKDKTDYATGLGLTYVIAADMNGDGNMDLVTANNGANTISVLLGNGDGTFKDKTDFATGSNPRSVVAADLNGDGNQDLVTVNDSGSVSVLLGNGDGTFKACTTFTAGWNPVSVIAADLNGDGKLDLAAASTSGTVSVLLGNGDGTFKSKIDFATGSRLSYIIAADINGDGKLDLVIKHYDDSASSVLLNTTNNTPPLAADDFADVDEGSTNNFIDVLTNDTDADGDILKVQAIGSAEHGTLTLVDGRVLYTPAFGYAGLDSFTYTAADGFGTTSVGTAWITVTPVAPAITVTSPNGGELWIAGSTLNVTWTSAGSVGNVDIELSTDGGATWQALASDTANDGQEAITVPADHGTESLVRVKQASDETISDVSDAAFTITTWGDVNADGKVDGGDLNIILSNWNESGTAWDTGDLTGDGFIDGGDLNILLSNWNAQPVPVTSASQAGSAAGLASDADPVDTLLPAGLPMATFTPALAPAGQASSATPTSPTISQDEQAGQSDTLDSLLDLLPQWRLAVVA